LRKVKQFRQDCIDAKTIFFKDFVDGDFKDLIREKLEEIGWKETEILLAPQAVDQSSKSLAGAERFETKVPSEKLLLDDDVRRFLNALTERPQGWESISSLEVARLRLIGSSLKRSGNDDEKLGNHDANLIYRQMRDAALSEQEILGLIDAGIAGFKFENVPLWKWLTRDPDGLWKRVAIESVAGSNAERVQAFAILGLGVRAVPNVNDVITKRELLDLWLTDNVNNDVFDAAVDFLSSFGNSDLLPDLQRIIPNLAPHRSQKLKTAIVSVLSRDDINAAVSMMVADGVEQTDRNLLQRVFSNVQSLSTPIVANCLGAKSEQLRLKAVEILSERNELPLVAATSLLTDSNHEIRLLAAETLHRLGVGLSDETIRKALRIVRQPSGGLFAFIGRSDPDDTYYDRYLINRHQEMPLKELKVAASDSGMFRHHEIAALYKAYPTKMADEMRQNLDDLFKAYFDAKVARAAETEQISADRLYNIRAAEGSFRKKLSGLALTALCGLMKSQDIQLVREVLATEKVEASSEILEYLGRFGSWADIDTIKSLGDDESEGILLIRTTKLAVEKALAIFALGKDRVADMLELDLDSSIRVNLAKLLPKKIVADLLDQILLRELDRSSPDKYRAVFALKCVQSLPKTRVSQLLEKYIREGKSGYYNTVHWLDL
jgi:hypothetical protein